MPSSFVTYSGDGSTKTFSFAAIDGYLNTGYIKVYIDDALIDPANYTIDVSGGNENVVFAAGYAAPAAKTTIKIARETPQTTAGYAANIVDFTDGSILTADDLDKGLTGLLHIIQEANDTGNGALGPTADTLNWDAAKKRVTNAAAAIDRSDLVTKAQLDAASVYGNAVTLPQAWEFTGTGAQTTFILDPLPAATDADLFLVEVGGVLQRPSGNDPDYEIGANNIKFLNGAPAINVGIRIRNFGVARAVLDVLPDQAITTDYIEDGAVTAPKLAANAVISEKINAGAVESAALASGAVTDGKIATNAINTANIKNLQVTEAKIGVGAVTTDKIAPLSVSTDKLGTSSVTSDKIAQQAINWLNLNSSQTGTLFASSSGVEKFLKIGASGALSLENLSNLPLGGTASSNVNMAGFQFTGLGNPTGAGQAVTTGMIAPTLVDIFAGYGLINHKNMKSWIVAGWLSMTGNTPTEVKDWTGTYNAVPATSFDSTNFDLLHRAGTAGINQMVIIKPKAGFGTWSIVGLATTTGGTIQTLVVNGVTSAATMPASAQVDQYATFAAGSVGSNILTSMAFFAVRTS